MKIKLFSNCNFESLENDVNAFLATVTVIDVKFSTADNCNDIMVIYDEKTENNDT